MGRGYFSWLYPRQDPIYGYNNHVCRFDFSGGCWCHSYPTPTLLQGLLVQHPHPSTHTIAPSAPTHQSPYVVSPPPCTIGPTCHPLRPTWPSGPCVNGSLAAEAGPYSIAVMTGRYKNASNRRAFRCFNLGEPEAGAVTLRPSGLTCRNAARLAPGLRGAKVAIQRHERT